jgi:hypothetical protein
MPLLTICRTCSAAVALLALLAAGCSSGADTPGQIHAPTATMTMPPVSTPSPTQSPTPVPRPIGWQVYHGAHFTLAYPPAWTVEATPQGDSTPSSPNVVYSFVSPDRTAAVQVQELDGLDDATVQHICAGQSRNALVTFAGLPMRYDATVAAGRVRDWAFVTDRGTAYTLAADDYFGTATSSNAIKAQNEAMLATFRPDEGYGTSGCR